MKITVIGAGNTGQAVATHLASMDADIMLYTRSADKAKYGKDTMIEISGLVEGKFNVPTTTDISEAIKNAKYIFVMTRANAHKDVAENLKGKLSQGQTILIFNGNWAAMEFKKILNEEIKEKEIVIAETAAQLYTAQSPKFGKVNTRMKNQVQISAVDPSQTEDIIEGLKKYFPTQFGNGHNILLTSLSNTNPIIHGPITIFNIVRVENGENFKFYGNGLSHKIVNYILKLDKERMEIAEKLNADTIDILTGINSFWDIKYDNLFDALNKNEGYLKVNGPSTFNHRYITEDIPFGIVPVTKLGKMLEVETPYSSAFVDIAEKVLEEDFSNMGPDFSKDDFKNFI